MSLLQVAPSSRTHVVRSPCTVSHPSFVSLRCRGFRSSVSTIVITILCRHDRYCINISPPPPLPLLLLLRTARSVVTSLRTFVSRLPLLRAPPRDRGRTDPPLAVAATAAATAAKTRKTTSIVAMACTLICRSDALHRAHRRWYKTVMSHRKWH
uniref:Uncharacterized protein n=1 Tax=Schizaphis graminum TaxID=13262 RepID=A0A2S2NJ09_SCHGA